MHQRAFRKGSGPENLGDSFAIAGQTMLMLGIVAQRFFGMGALIGPAADAGAAMAAKLDQRTHDMVAHDELAHFRADRQNDTRQFMPQNGG